uniref:Uncharacterized protein n=1 Tax=Arundo donax TaxID=35708 RepID=A0A0A9HRV6_ARUDO
MNSRDPNPNQNHSHQICHCAQSLKPSTFYIGHSLFHISVKQKGKKQQSVKNTKKENFTGCIIQFPQRWRASCAK